MRTSLPGCGCGGSATHTDARNAEAIRSLRNILCPFWISLHSGRARDSINGAGIDTMSQARTTPVALPAVFYLCPLNWTPEGRNWFKANVASAARWGALSCGHPRRGRCAANFCGPPNWELRAALATLGQRTSFGATANIWNFYAEGSG